MYPKRIITSFIVIIGLCLVFAAAKAHYIDQNICTKCGVCIEECPEEAIMIVKKDGEEIHVIDQEKCIQCGVCIDGCPEGAIKIGDPVKDGLKKKKD